MAQMAIIIGIATRTSEDGGKKSARAIPNPAITARPTNGWRGIDDEFIATLFAYRVLARQAAIASGTQKRQKTPNVQHRTLNRLNWMLGVERWTLKPAIKIWDPARATPAERCA